VTPARQLGYVILYVADLDRSIAFYRDSIGLQLKFVDAGYAEFASGPTRFALYEQRRASWLIDSPTTPGPAAEVVFVVDDVDEEARQLSDAGVPVLAPPTDRPWGHRTVHVADPDGFVVELAQEIARRRDRKSPDGSGAAAEERK
jgi:lactoylglutathione lyase